MERPYRHRLIHTAAIAAQDNGRDVAVQGRGECGVVALLNGAGQNETVSVAGDRGGRCWRGGEQDARSADIGR